MRTVIRASLIAAVAAAVLYAAGGPALAQEPLVSAEVDRTELTTDDTLTLTLTIRGSRVGSGPALTGLRGFAILGTSISMSRRTIQGETTSEEVHVFTLQPSEAGTLTIDPISVTVDGRSHSTEPITVTVTQGTGASPQPRARGAIVPQADELTGQDFYVEAEVENPQPYIGQQTAYVFRFYRAAGLLVQPSDYGAPDFVGFWRTDQTNEGTYGTRAAGRDYRVTELRTIIFPSVTGRQTIGPAALTIPLPVPGGFFRRASTLTTNPVEVEVRPLPEGAPDGFTGAVGQLDIRARVNRRVGVVGDPLTLTVTVTGRANFENLADPVWPDMPQWRSFDSAAAIDTNVNSGRLTGRKVYERVLIPNTPGDVEIPPIVYPYFDPDASIYRTASTGPIRVSVAPADGEPPAPATTGSEAAEQEPTDIRHIKPAPSRLRTGGGGMASNALYWAAWAAPPLLLALAYAGRRLRGRLAAGSPRGRARKRAEAMLAEARRGGDPHEAAARALTSYLADRLGRPVSGLIHDAIAALLEERSVGRETIDRVLRCLAASEGGRFAPTGNGPAHGDSLLDGAEAVIGALEEEMEP